MEHSRSCEANRSSASQEIPCILWNPKLHYHIHKRPPHLSLSWANLIQSMLLSHFLRIEFNIFFLSTPRSSKCFLSVRCTHQIPVSVASPVSHTCHMPCPSHSSWFGHPNGIECFNFNPSWFAWTFLRAFLTLTVLLFKVTLFVLMQ